MPQPDPPKSPKTLQKKLLWLVILAACLPSLIFYILNQFMVTKNIKNILVNTQKHETQLGARQVSLFLNNLKNNVKSDVQSNILLIRQNNKLIYNKVEMNGIFNKYHYVKSLIICDSKGRPLMGFHRKNGRIRHRAGIKNGKSIPLKKMPEGNTYSFMVISDKSGTPLPEVITTLHDSEKRRVGYLRARFDIAEIFDVMESVCHPEGCSVYLMQIRPGENKTQPMVVDANVSKVSPPDNTLLQELRSTGGDEIYYFNRLKRDRMLATSAPILGSGWLLFVERPTRDYFRGVVSILNITLPVFLVVIIIYIYVAYRLIKSFLEPFSKLSEGVDAISQGNLKYRLDLKTNDEIQNLAESFNRMVESLENQRKQTSFALKEVKKKKRELEVSIKHLKEASRLRSEFLANMSHELRTPLNTVVGYTSIMLDGIYGKLEDKQRETLEKIYERAFNLSHLINDVLDLTKIDAGKTPIFRERFRVSQVIREILLQYRPRIEEKGLDLTLDIETDLEIESDRAKIKQVLDHLIGNGVKFTEKGGITISSEKTPRRDYLKISIMDTGLGIKKEHLGKIFDEFRQLDGSHTREYGGTGLGLAICKRILKMLNAKITVKSKEGQGSNFTIYLPLEPSEVPVKTAPTPKTIVEAKSSKAVILELEDVTKKPILSIDNDPEFLAIMADIVAGTDYQVLTADNLDEGLEMARKYRPYLITIDLVMADKPVKDMMEKLKTDPVTLDIPVFVISAVDERTTAYSRGASEFFLKPLDRGHFLKRLDALNQWRGHRMLVIDDDPDFLEQFFIIMREHSMQITTCSDSREGLRRLRKDKPDLLILDVVLPEMDGNEILKVMDNENILEDIPVVIMTAKDLKPEERESLESRAFAIVEKGMLRREKLIPRMMSIFDLLWCNDE